MHDTIPQERSCILGWGEVTGMESKRFEVSRKKKPNHLSW